MIVAIASVSSVEAALTKIKVSVVTYTAMPVSVSIRNSTVAVVATDCETSTWSWHSNRSLLMGTGKLSATVLTHRLVTRNRRIIFAGPPTRTCDMAGAASGDGVLDLAKSILNFLFVLLDCLIVMQD